MRDGHQKMFRAKHFTSLIARRPYPAGRGNNSTHLFARLEALKSVVDVPRETIWDKGTLFKEQCTMLSVQQNVKHYSYFDAQWNVNNISYLRNDGQSTMHWTQWSEGKTQCANNVCLQNVNIISYSHLYYTSHFFDFLSFFFYNNNNIEKRGNKNKKEKIIIIIIISKKMRLLLL